MGLDMRWYELLLSFFVGFYICEYKYVSGTSLGSFSSDEQQSHALPMHRHLFSYNVIDICTLLRFQCSMRTTLTCANHLNAITRSNSQAEQRSQAAS